MSIILVLIPLSILFAVAFLAAFIWAVRSGQYEDTCTPSMRVLADEPALHSHPVTRMGPPSPPGEGARPASQNLFPSTAAASVADANNGVHSTDAIVAPPLPGGEGRGEGEH